MAHPLRIVIVGHVDHGKSTLIGRLLLDTGSLPDGKLAQLDAIARRRGAPMELANVMDALQAERDQNVTIDTAQIWFRTPAREYVLIDAPGHKEFLKNMVTGAAQADAACLIIDAAEGMQEQSRRHAVLLQFLGVYQVVVLVNKMDLVDYDEARFLAIARECDAFVRSAGLPAPAIVPVSARHGDNVAARSARMPWWEGPTAVELLDTLAAAAPPEHLPLRFPIQDVYKFDDRRIAAGRVESGTLHVGDALVFCPGNKFATIKTIERWKEEPRSSATAGESIGVTLEKPIFLERGSVGVPEEAFPYELTRFEARLLWLGIEPLRFGQRYPLKLTTQAVECEVELVHRIVDASTLEPVRRADPSVALEKNDVAEVALRVTRPLVFDTYSENPALGRFVVMDGGEVAGGGVVLEGNYPKRTAGTVHRAANVFWTPGKVTAAQRAVRIGHAGSIVWLTGLSGSGKSTIAAELERELFARGCHVYVLDGDHLRHGLCADLGFSEEDRVENIRRAGEVAVLLADAGLIVIAAFISPYRAGRNAVRLAAPGGRFLEVFLNAPLAVCEARDAKGLYARARTGEIAGFTGISSPYEPPEQPEIELKTDRETVEQCVAAIVAALQRGAR
jgi:bifunctional enzyme CysN/CysC